MPYVKSHIAVTTKHALPVVLSGAPKMPAARHRRTPRREPACVSRWVVARRRPLYALAPIHTAHWMRLATAGLVSPVYASCWERVPIVGGGWVVTNDMQRHTLFENTLEPILIRTYEHGYPFGLKSHGLRVQTFWGVDLRLFERNERFHQVAVAASYIHDILQHIEPPSWSQKEGSSNPVRLLPPIRLTTHCSLPSGGSPPHPWSAARDSAAPGSSSAPSACTACLVSFASQ